MKGPFIMFCAHTEPRLSARAPNCHNLRLNRIFFYFTFDYLVSVHEHLQTPKPKALFIFRHLCSVYLFVLLLIIC